MLDAVLKLFGAKQKKTSAETAHDRLKLVLAHDRAGVSPEVMESIKNDIIQVISKYMEIDRNAMEISLENDSDSAFLVANIPVQNMRRPARKKRA